MSRMTRRGLLGGTAAEVVTVPLARHGANAAAEPPTFPAPARTPENAGRRAPGERHPSPTHDRSAHHAARRAARAARPDRHEEGLRSGRVRRVHGARRRPADAVLPHAGARCEGKAITTIEGLARRRRLHPVQAAFIHHDGFQCGYCTPGQIMSAVALLEEGHAGTDDEIREWMSGNICRCGAYPNIVARDPRTRRGRAEPCRPLTTSRPPTLDDALAAARERATPSSSPAART